MNNNQLKAIVKITYEIYVNRKEYLQEGRTTPMSFEEYTKDLRNKAKTILQDEE